MENQDVLKTQWIYRLKKKILLGLFALLTTAIIIMLIFIIFMVRRNLLDENLFKTQELGRAISSSLETLMINRTPALIQGTLDQIEKGSHSIQNIYILNNKGKIAFASPLDNIGVFIDRFSNESCRSCHYDPEKPPHINFTVLDRGEKDVLRIVKVIYNKPQCHGCHQATKRVNGKLIIDRSLRDTYRLITKIEVLVIIAGLFCLALAFPFLSKSVDRYIQEILNQHSELSFLYIMLERLSKTINYSELREIVTGISSEILPVDKVDIIIHKGRGKLSHHVWNRHDGKIHREPIPAEGPLALAISGWMGGKHGANRFIEGGGNIYMFIDMMDERLALLAAGPVPEGFSRTNTRMLNAMAEHMAVAFNNARLYNMAITDELTGLYTQRHFRHSLDQLFFLYENNQEEFCLILIDLDDFKNINDTYGHLAGDRVLNVVSQHMIDQIRDLDLAFRYGGEELAVLLPSTHLSYGAIMAERIRASIVDLSIKADIHTLSVTVSIGVASCPTSATSQQDLIQAADKALYEAKRSGKNMVKVSS